jgi:hypothetical protein
VLISIQKSVEECCRFLLGLSFMIVDKGEKQDRAHLEKIQELRVQLGNENFAKPGYMKQYYQNTSLKLVKDMEDLAAGLRLHGAEIVLS